MALLSRTDLDGNLVLLTVNPQTEHMIESKTGTGSTQFCVACSDIYLGIGLN